MSLSAQDARGPKDDEGVYTAKFTVTLFRCVKLSSMIGGTIVVTYVWWTNSFAWTWYALIGSACTSGVAVALSFVLPQRADA